MQLHVCGVNSYGGCLGHCTSGKQRLQPEVWLTRGATLVPKYQRGGRARERFECRAFLPAVAGGLANASSGWLVAGTILIAVRLGRQQAEADRIAAYQGKTEDAVLQERQRLQRRKLQERRSMQAAEERLMEARQKAEEQEQERQRSNRALLRAAERQQELARQAQAAERAAFEAKEAELRAELERRTGVERELRAQRAAEARAAEEQRRREAEERKRQIELDRQRQEEERLAEKRAERERMLAERKERQRRARQFAIRLEGTAAVSTPPEGTQTQGRLPKDAMLQLELTFGSTIGGYATPRTVAFESVDIAVEQVSWQTAVAAFAGAEQYRAAARLQNMTGQGPLTAMGEAELLHWMRLASVRAAAVAIPKTRQMLEQYSARRAAASISLEVRTARGILPESDPKRTDALLGHAISAVEADDMGRAEEILTQYAQEEEEMLSQDLETAIPQHVGTALALAFFLDFMWEQRPAKRVEVSPWYDAASALAGRLLTQTTQGAPKDSLRAAADLVVGVLGNEHVIARLVERLAEANLSQQTRARLKEREASVQAELAERLVEIEWPDKAEVAAARQQEIEATTPVPERVWALRNVGATLAMGGSGERARARQLLERAVTLKKAFVGGAKHPGMLPELDALAGVLESVPEWEQDVAAVRSRMLGILTSIAELYVRSGDTASAVLLLEASVREYEELLGLRQPGIVSATKRANQLFETLTDEERAKVAGARLKRGVLASVIRSFEEEVASRQTPGTRLKFERWDEAGIDMLGRLIDG